MIERFGFSAEYRACACFQIKAVAQP